MKWNRIEVSWKLLKDNLAFRLFRSSYDDSENHDPIGPEIPTVRQIDEGRPAAFHPDDQGRRSEFSLHIGS